MGSGKLELCSGSVPRDRRGRPWGADWQGGWGAGPGHVWWLSSWWQHVAQVLVVPARASPGQRKGTVQPKGRRWSQRGPTGSVEVTEVRSRRALSSGVQCQECQGHQAPTSCHYQRGTGRGGAGAGAAQPGVRHSGAGARDLWPQAEIHFAECFDLPFPFLWTLALAQGTRRPAAPTPEVASGPAPPNTFLVLLPPGVGGPSTRRPSSPVPSEKHRLGFLLSGQPRTRVPQVVCGHRVSGENQSPVLGTPPPGPLGFQVSKSIRTSLSLAFPTCEMGALDYTCPLVFCRKCLHLCGMLN